MDIYLKSCSTHGKPNLCDKCNQKFDYPSDYIKHYQDMHGSLPPEYKDKETFVCDQCPRVFITKNHLGAHIERVHSKKYNSMGKYRISERMSYKESASFFRKS